MRMLRRIITFIIAILLIAFSVMNRHDVAFFWSPSAADYPIPLYFIFFAGIFFGLLAAAYATSWLRLKAFARARKAERQAAELERERDSLHEEVTKLKADERYETQSQQPIESELVSQD